MLRNSRIAVVHLVLGGVAAAILARAAPVRGGQAKRWQARAGAQHVAASSTPAPRGLIVDASGNPLAESRERVQLAIATRELRDARRVNRELARGRSDAPWLAR